MSKQNESRKYQEMLEEVESIVRDLSQNTQDLDEVASKVKRGHDLVKAMRDRLDQTRMSVERMQSSELP
jgi:exodeoxyribonuclease VII small subunit